jgi:prepilin-type N-terminal cleavage/methylation domain-containing protein
MNKEQRAMNIKQSGFTIIELLIATTIFSIVLMIILASFLQISRMFYKGVSLDNTNEAARTLVDDITSDIRLAKDGGTATSPGPNNTHFFCVGLHRYTFKLGVKVTSPQVTSPDSITSSAGAGVREDTVGSGCPIPIVGAITTNPQQLLGPDMQLNDFGTNCGKPGGLCGIDCASALMCNIHTHIVFYGFDSTVLKPSAADQAAECTGNTLDTQFCATADIKTNVMVKQ